MDAVSHHSRRALAFFGALVAVGLAGCQSSSTTELTDDVVVAETAASDGTTTTDGGSSESTSEQNSPETTESDENKTDDTDSADDDTGSDLPDSAPDSFWAITDETYELVEVDSRTGEILDRFGAWGDPFGGCEPEEDDCLFQGLNELAVGNGHIWISDCCEPAAGNLFKVEIGTDFSTDSFVVYGTHPVPSPSGDLVAHTGLELTVIADSSGQQLGVLGGVADGADADGPPVWHQPVAWLDDEILVVRVTGDLVDNLVLFDVSDPSAPQQTGPSMGGVISHTDAAVRSDGMIFALARSYRGDDDASSDLMGWVFDPSTGEVVAETDLPDDIWAIDYDASGTFLLTVGQEGVVRFFGAGQSGVVADGFVAVSW